MPKYLTLLIAVSAIFSMFAGVDKSGLYSQNYPNNPKKNYPNYRSDKKKPTMILERGKLYIFGTESCGRTFTVKNKLTEDKIPFIFIDLAKEKEKVSDLFALLRQKGYVSSNIKYPVCFYNEGYLYPVIEKHFAGKVFHRQKYMDDLMRLMESSGKGQNNATVKDSKAK